MCKEEKQSLHFTQKVRDIRLNQLRTEPWMPNQDESQVKCHGLWYKRQQRGQGDRDKKVFCEQIAVMRWSWMYTVRETFWWNGAVGKQIGEDSEDCERKGDQ